MPLPLVPITVVVLTAWAAATTGKRLLNRGKLTPERQVIYEQALKSKDVKVLRTMADAFEKEGLKPQAELLRKRANLRELPEETKKARREAFDKGMKSSDVVGIRKLADAFESEGATGAADTLRRYATGLEAGGTPGSPSAPEEFAGEHVPKQEPTPEETSIPKAEVQNADGTTTEVKVEIQEVNGAVHVADS